MVNAGCKLLGVKERFEIQADAKKAQTNNIKTQLLTIFGSTVVYAQAQEQTRSKLFISLTKCSVEAINLLLGHTRIWRSGKSLASIKVKN